MQESTRKNFPKVYTFMYTIIRDPTTENKFYYYIIIIDLRCVR